MQGLRRRGGKLAVSITLVCVVAGTAVAALINMTLEDFHTSGTQVLDVGTDVIWTSDNCTGCHSDFDSENEPWATWKGSLMGLAGRDPLFYAQMATANQDVANVGYFCMRCHVPMSFVTGHAYDTLGETLDRTDMDGVTCHFCHAMVDPIYKPGISPPEDEGILRDLAEVPQHYGNAMFVLDPEGRRRGPRAEADPLHEFILSPFHETSEYCGTCHDVGNLAVSRQPDGTYLYNTIDEPTPDEDPWAQFPLERTYTEWKLSEFATSGVDMGGRFGGHNVTIVSTCQDCHMPRAEGKSCIVGNEYDDLARHDFAGAAAPILDLIAEYYQNDPDVDLKAIAAARAKSVSMLQRAASLELEQQCGSLKVRVINETGHKLPTGHIEGRRVWVNVRLLDANGALLREYGHYDEVEAHLDEHSTEIYEMHVGLSEYAAKITGLPPGLTQHMALADVIEKDTRIPPRGFDNAAFEEGGAPPVGIEYADGQYWDDSYFALPENAVRAEVAVYYQNLPRHYMEVLRDGNQTNHWGQTLWDLWVTTGKGAPIEMVSHTIPLGGFALGDLTCDGLVDHADHQIMMQSLGERDSPADLNGDRIVDLRDLAILLGNVTRGGVIVRWR